MRSSRLAILTLVALAAPLASLGACGSSGSSGGGGSGASPSLTKVSPDHGSARGGDAVTVTGEGFGDSPTVRFGDVEAKVTSSSATRIEVVTPEEAAGAVEVSVKSGSAEAHLAKAFTFDALTLSFVDVAWKRLSPTPIDGGEAAFAGKDVVQAGGAEGLWVHPGDGKGSFGAPNNVPAGTSIVRSLAVGDLDGDGKLDVVAGTTGQTLSQVFLGGGQHSFTASVGALPPIFGTHQSTIAVDLDGDGALDLVMVGVAPTAMAAPQVMILHNDGSGSFTDVTSKKLAGDPFDATGVVAGDVDGDGHVDLFFSGDQDPCRLYLNDGKGTFQRASPDALPSLEKPGAGVPAMGDLDGDGSLDIYLPSTGQDHVLLNDGTGRFADLGDQLLGPETGAGQRATLVDLDADGHLDALVVESPGRLRVLRNDGTGRLFDYSGDLAGNDATLAVAGVAAGDTDGDGDLDLFVSRPGFARASLFLNWAPLSIDKTTDTDGDGFPDDVDNCPDVANPDQANLDSLPFRCDSAASCATATGCDLVAAGASAYLVCATAKATWADASAACEARGASLLAIDDADENAALLALGLADAWIGFTDAAKEGTFAWSSGATSSYTNWAATQPDGSGDCAVFLADGTWDDDACSQKRGYVCEDARSRAPDPGDACDPCPTAYDPDSSPVDPDAGTTCGADGGAP